MAEILVWIFFGGLVGWIGNLDTGSHYRHASWQHIIIGIIGALFGGLLVSLITYSGTNEFHSGAFIVALLMAVTVVGLFRTMRQI